MLYPSADAWANAPHKRLMLFGMSGLGKTHISNMLRATGDWFHYSVDYRIGTRYMGEHIADALRLEAMQSPLLAGLLRSDSVSLRAKMRFDNLTPLSTFLGKPGDPARGGIPFDEYIRRQRLHRRAEINAMQDTAAFVRRAQSIYGYAHFVCDTSGSLVEVVDERDADDPVMAELVDQVLPVWLEGSDDHIDTLVARFKKAPKPMYYNEDFLRALWSDYTAQRPEAEVDPDDFIVWGYRRLLDHRLPRYRAIADRWGITIKARDVEALRNAADLDALISDTLAAR